MVSNPDNIFHKRIGVFKNIGVELLNEIFVFVTVFFAEFKYVGVVDMTVKKLSNIFKLSFEFESSEQLGNVYYFVFQNRCHAFLKIMLPKQAGL